ncbi:50S ribosome-binding GTPase [Blastopirellula sp. JC732]|uniref:50S ribosome-binding GTPase n=1 Tax=Blastopirellula sediminis TaxID=2894196 RepID=A0A9X1SHA1_9BACT|nr:GTPase [Blastopirellula sediminis]MCC9607116.1 50S ribosome-binding GTPase [Blastopirellula sediminis]MCC9629591.1 50S ribosome-binding GTPase [Blastopirellula sediminis]
MSETIAALITPGGRSAIATIVVAGPKAGSAVDRHFFPLGKKQASTCQIGDILVGHWRDSAEDAGEELVVSRTAADRIEVHCHGGIAAFRRILNHLVAAGCREIAWSDYAHQSESSPIAAAARIALADARTSRTAGYLLDQYNGALEAELTAILGLLDAQQTSDAQLRLQSLLATANFGMHLTKPWKVVIAGRPNVGKSSLINALVGYERAIVFDQPGTTRDAVTAAAAFDGWPVELADTAGLRESDDAIEREGVARARKLQSAADLILLALDQSAPWTDEDQQLLAAYPNAIVIHNKSDLPADESSQRPAGLKVSAQRGDGIEQLNTMIGHTLVPTPPLHGTPLLFTGEQVAAVQQAAAQRPDAAIQTLRTLLA